MTRKSLFKTIIIAICAITLTACHKDLPPGDYDSNEVGKIKRVIPGTIISKREVNLHNKSAESLDASSKDNGFNQTRGVEYVVKLNSGSIISVVQVEDLKLKPKEKILVIYGQNTRIVADNGSESY